MEKTVSITRRQILAWILLLTCFLTVFLPWIKIRINVLGQTYTPRDLVELGMGLGGAEGSVDEWVEESIRDSYRRDPDQRVSESAAVDAVMCIFNGRMNLLQASRTAGTFSRSIQPEKAAVSYGGETAQSSSYAMQQEELKWASSAKTKLMVGCVLGWALLAVLALSILLAAWGVYRGETRHVRHVLVPALALLALNLISVWQCNSGIGEIMELLGGSDYASILGSGFKLFHTGVAPFLCPLLAALAWLTLRGKEEEAPALSLGRVCPGCGARSLGRGDFCSHCGAALPKAASPFWICPGCGAKHLRSAAFCARCGAAKPAEAPVETPVPAEPDVIEKAPRIEEAPPAAGEQPQA